MNPILQDLQGEEILKVTLALFIVIDIVGLIPFILKTNRTTGPIYATKTTCTVALIGFAFLFFGQKLLALYNLNLSSFRTAGGIVLSILGAELLFDLEINKVRLDTNQCPSVSPLAFPIIAGTGTLAMLVTLQEEYRIINIMVGFSINLLLVYIVLRYIEWLEKLLPPLLINLFTKIAGLMLLTMGIHLIKHGFTQA